MFALKIFGATPQHGLWCALASLAQSLTRVSVRPTAVGMVTKIWELLHKIYNN